MKPRRQTEPTVNSFIRRERSDQTIVRTSSAGAWWYLLLPFVIIAFFYLFSGLNIRGVEIPATKFIDRDELVRAYEAQRGESAWLVFRQSNWLLFDAQALQTKLESDYYFNYLKVSKNLKNLSIVLQFDEKEYNLIWQEGETNHYVNYQGEIIFSVPANQPIKDKTVVVFNELASKRQGRSILVDEKYLRFASALDDALNAKTKGLSQRRLGVGAEFNTVKVLINNGPVLYFNTESDINDQLNKLEALRQSELADGRVFNAQKYIDLRYGKSIYYQ